ncbi:MAG: hypothetical protein Q8Q18_02640 [bacterium]|nr:hypothetical protein [bacterium]
MARTPARFWGCRQIAFLILSMVFCGLTTLQISKKRYLATAPFSLEISDEITAEALIGDGIKLFSGQ